MTEQADTGLSLWRSYLAAAIVGGLAGLVGAAFRALLARAERGRDLAHNALVDAPVPGWLLLMGLGALALIVGMWLVRRFAPETAGSGIPQVEACLAGGAGLRWQRVLPIKFIAGFLAVGSGLVLGREGPTVHMGAALGKLVTDWGRLPEHQGRTLLAAGAGAGLAAAFNAPLAAIVFVTEELREHFTYGFASVQSVILACCMAVAISSWLLGQGPLLPLDHLGTVPVAALPLFLGLGVLIGALGVLFNQLLLGSVQAFRGLAQQHALLVAGAVGMTLGAMLWFVPQAVGGGEALVESLLHRHPGTLFLLLLLWVRLLTTVGSYGLGLPGGIFAPLLALGTISGAACDGLVRDLIPGLALAPGVLAVAAMGALFAATVRAPLTGMILVIELTGAIDLGLPIILTCLTATFTAEGLGGRPIYSLLLTQGQQPPAPVRAAGRRLLMGAVILAALLALDQFNSRRQGRPGEPLKTPPGVAAESSGTRPAPDASPTMDPSTIGLDRDHPAAPTTPDRAPVEVPSAVVDKDFVRPPPAQAASVPAPAAGPVETPPPPAQTPAPSEGPGSSAADQTRYAIQLISFRSAASLAPFARRNDILDQARTLDGDGRGQRWYPLLLGEYGTRGEAEDALARLPAGLGHLGPTVRALSAGVRLVPVTSSRTGRQQ